MSPAPSPDEAYRATVAMLLTHARSTKHISSEDVMEIAALAPDELRRRAVVTKDWHRSFAACLNGMPELSAFGALPDDCWLPRDIRRVVQALLDRLRLMEDKKAASSVSRAPAARVLTLALKGEFFDLIASGEKVEEFRLCTPHWERRLVGRTYDKVVVTRGYPRAEDSQRRLEFPWRGFERRMHQHALFGPEPVEVFAIPVRAGDAPASL